MIVREPSVQDPRKILIRATNWIGDAVMSLPAIEALRARFPGAEIAILAKPWVGEVYLNHPAVNRLLTYDAEGAHRGWSGERNLVRMLRREEFDLAILFQNAFQAAWLAWRARIPVRIGYSTDGRGTLLTRPVRAPAPNEWGHQSNNYLQLLFHAGLTDPPRPATEIRLELQKSERTWAARRLKELGLDGPRFLVGLCPGASFGPAKRWPPERFSNLADRLIGGLHADVIIFGSGAERKLAEEIAHGMQHTPIIAAGDTTLRQWMALISTCRLVIANDSGLTHLASALGLPVIAIFGSTDERATAPLSPRTRVVKHRVDCSPCGLRVCPIDFRCMGGLGVEEVQRAALALVKE